jgi:hypothetical protein
VASETLLETFTLQPKELRSLIGFREEFQKLTESMEVTSESFLVDDLDK